jgi:tetraprenyl-beta-curcumene synthase
LSPREIATFAAAALRYWLAVYPRTQGELRRWRRRAARISDPLLRQAALDALAKRSNVEGAAAFAAAVRGRRRGAVVRALVAFQAIYDYVDVLAELPSPDPVANARSLHGALLVALDPDAEHLDYYAHHSRHQDRGYLAELVDDCREALRQLPSYSAVAMQMRSVGVRIVGFQSLSLGGRDALERWARSLVPAASGLRWWESAAAAGSSLGVNALIAIAADPALGGEQVTAIEGAYFPWIGALHSLLDSLIDEAEDAATGQLSLIGCYPSPEAAAMRMHLLATRGLAAAHELPHGRQHALLLAAMTCNYLSEPQASAPGALAVARSVRAAIGVRAAPAMLVFKMWRVARRSRGPGVVVAAVRAPAVVCLAEGERGADARAA